ncbi:uncharacterized protein HD556DRAFT_1539711 [Suillus plorans]|uniref:Uncharacterized protein n=1 Tax=Suillus plorans TaxID=116603 RepID=A0A9P7ACQ9_9AGAM|nr:uncharacterized protein HD556DRAFT_1539711 [Suillus plorans]KAG1786176.1 hypothetical protein HD556DRAFT_1539711 [Suillus plorans]
MVQLSAIAGHVLNFDVICYQSVHQFISSSDIMSSQPGVRFHDPPVTEYTSMDVDETSQSRMSLDPLDDIYLGPDDELDSDSGSSGGLDSLNAIPGMFLNSNVHILHVQIHHILPDPSYPALADGLALYDDPDLYLGPEDTFISSDDAPAVPDFPMAVNESTPEPHPATPAVPEAPIPSNSETPERQLPEPELNNDELRAMVQEFMPIGSYDQAENRLGDYEQSHGNLPAPTVAQLLEADRHSGWHGRKHATNCGKQMLTSGGCNG